MMLWVWLLILMAFSSGIVSLAIALPTSEGWDDGPPHRTREATIWLWIAPGVMALSIAGAVTLYHIQWATRYAQETTIVDARFGTENVVGAIDQRESWTYGGWRDVLVVLHGTPYDRTLKLRVNPANGGVMKW